MRFLSLGFVLFTGCLSGFGSPCSGVAFLPVAGCACRLSVFLRAWRQRSVSGRVCGVRAFPFLLPVSSPGLHRLCGSVQFAGCLYNRSYALGRSSALFGFGPFRAFRCSMPFLVRSLPAVWVCLAWLGG